MNRNVAPTPFEGPVHFMGIAGAGMVSLAELFARNGIEISGCDLQPDPVARSLSSWGCQVISGHDPAHVEGISALVVTAAAPSEHPEIQAARDRGVPVLKRAEALAMWVDRGRVVGVAGTHGKTTTTAMATDALAAAGMDPTGLVGGRVVSWESNLRFGGDEIFVVEADEYDRSFHHLSPEIAVLTNVEADHLDIYGDLDGVLDSFRIFLDRVDPQGLILASGDDHGVGRLLPGCGDRVRTFGINPGCQLRAVDVRPSGSGTRFGVTEDGEDRGEITLGVPGGHNVVNALGAAMAARALGGDWPDIKTGLEAFRGVGRRFQLLGEVGGVTVVDDYAHHPTEVRAALDAARNRFPGRRIVAVFQPHLFSRTRDFAEGFGQALALADQVWVTEIYPAREEPIPGVSGVMVAQATLDAGASSVSFHPKLGELPGEVLPTLRQGDVCITLGAGSIEFVGPDLLALLRTRTSEEVKPA
jgi:UDP-N-acetylmuramate--alanine ligase